MRVLFLAAALLLASAGDLFAASFPPWNPPKRFDYTYRGKIHYTYGYRNYPWRCWNAYACTYADTPSRGHCTMYMPYRDERIARVVFDLKSWRSLFRHEQGHCNGWPGSHPK